MAGDGTSAAAAAAASSSSDNAARDADLAKTTFIEDVAAHVGARPVEEVLFELQERLRRLRSYEAQMLATRARLEEKLPAIQKSLDAVQALVARRGSGTPAAVDFELADSIYAKATLRDDLDAVGLWLGAGVMVEYPLDEAAALLADNKAACEAALAAAARDLRALKDGVTVTEVNTARVFNYDVEQRRALKAKGGG